jgi:hypothetical protein
LVKELVVLAASCKDGTNISDDYQKNNSNILFYAILAILRH